MYLSYKYRLSPTKAQHRALERILESQRQLYNGALEERIAFYAKTGKTRSCMDQCAALTEWRNGDSSASSVPANLQRWTLKRLDDAYVAFFRRLKAKAANAGFPRFRSKDGWASFGFREFSGVRLGGGRLRFKGLPGRLRVRFHRPMPNGKPRACVFTKDTKGWAVCFQVEQEAAPPRAVIRSAVGIDLGLKVFAYQSDGILIQNPKIARRAEAKVRRRQRATARCQKTSRARRKAKLRLARVHAKISNTRSTWLHRQSALLVKSYDLVAAERLNVSGMAKQPTLARSIYDVSWSKFLEMVSYKAERVGGHFVAVNPRNTSQRCSKCSELVPKSLAARTHSCPNCGLVIDRDWNAARNILQAVVGLGQPNVTCAKGVRAARNLVLRKGETLPTEAHSQRFAFSRATTIGSDNGAEANS